MIVARMAAALEKKHRKAKKKEARSEVLNKKKAPCPIQAPSQSSNLQKKSVHD
jgi:hypothetical protein